MKVMRKILFITMLSMASCLFANEFTTTKADTTPIKEIPEKRKVPKNEMPTYALIPKIVDGKELP